MAEAKHSNGGNASEKGWARRVHEVQKETSLQHCGKGGNRRLTMNLTLTLPQGQGQAGSFFLTERAGDSAREEGLVSHGGVPIVNSRLLIAPDAAPRNWFFSEAARLPWMGSSTKSVPPRRVVLTPLDQGSAQIHPQIMLTAE